MLANGEIAFFLTAEERPTVCLLHLSFLPHLSMDTKRESLEPVLSFFKDPDVELQGGRTHGSVTPSTLANAPGAS